MESAGVKEDTGGVMICHRGGEEKDTEVNRRVRTTSDVFTTYVRVSDFGQVEV